MIIKQKWRGGAVGVWGPFSSQPQWLQWGPILVQYTRWEHWAVILACLDNDDHTCRGCKWEGVELSKHCLLFTITHFYSQATDWVSCNLSSSAGPNFPTAVTPKPTPPPPFSSSPSPFCSLADICVRKDNIGVEIFLFAPFLFCFCWIKWGKYDRDIMQKSLHQLLHRKHHQILYLYIKYRQKTKEREETRDETYC